MRNDARPVGVEAHDQSPVASDHVPGTDAMPADHRDTVTHDRQSHIVNQGAERGAEDEPRRLNDGAGDDDPTMPTGDSTLNTKI